MSISPEDLSIGCLAHKRIENYERQKPKRLATYLIPWIWLVSSIARYEASDNSWYFYEIIFWVFMLIAIIGFGLNSKREYRRDLRTLTQLRKHYGEARYVEATTELVSGPSAEDFSRGLDRLRRRGFKPLIEFGIVLALCFGLKYLVSSIWHLFK